MHLRGLPILASAAWVIGMAASVRADPFLVTATRTGWFANNGQHSSGNPNYEIGDVEDNFLLRDFLTFTLPLPGAGKQFVAATLTIPTNAISTSDPSETATFFDVSTAASTLSASHSSGDSAGLAAYADLGSGTIFGSRVYFLSDPPGSSTITLNSAALDAMNAAVPGSSFSIGGAVTSLDAIDNIEIIYVGAAGPSFPQLALTTGPAPEPGSAVMLGMIAAGFAARRSPARLKTN